MKPTGVGGQVNEVTFVCLCVYITPGPGVKPQTNKQCNFALSGSTKAVITPKVYQQHGECKPYFRPKRHADTITRSGSDLCVLDWSGSLRADKKLEAVPALN